MDITLAVGAPERLRTDVLVVGAFSDGLMTRAGVAVDFNHGRTNSPKSLQVAIWARQPDPR